MTTDRPYLSSIPQDPHTINKAVFQAVGSELFQALEGRVTQLELELQRLRNELSVRENATQTLPESCHTRTCDYYIHYLAYSGSQHYPGPDLSHDSYHAAAGKCAEYQKMCEAWLQSHPDVQHVDLNPDYQRLNQRAEYWEKRVRA